MSYKIRSIMLDYDMTLMYNIFDLYDAFIIALKKHLNKSVSFDEFYNMFMNYELDKMLNNINKHMFWRYHRRICRTLYGYPMKGLHYFLYWVKNLGLKTIIISGRERHPHILLFELQKFGLDEYIDDIYTLLNLYIYGGEEKELFDKSWLIKYVLEKYGADNSEAVYLGDHKLDYISSMKTGVRFIGIAFSTKRVKHLLNIGVKYIARDFYEALLYLLEMMK